MKVKCYLKAKRNKNIEKHFIEVKNHLLKSIIRISLWLLTYDLRIRKPGPRFHLVSCNKKHFLKGNSGRKKVKLK